MKTEAHITIDPAVTFASKEQIKQCIEDYGWFFSEIFADPDLEQKNYYYATKSWSYINEGEQKSDIFNLNATLIAHTPPIWVKRAKIEVTIYDSNDLR